MKNQIEYQLLEDFSSTIIVVMFKEIHYNIFMHMFTEIWTYKIHKIYKLWCCRTVR